MASWGKYLREVCVITERLRADASNELVLWLNVSDGHYLELQKRNLPNVRGHLEALARCAWGSAYPFGNEYLDLMIDATVFEHQRDAHGRR
jgi:hypothetical protein